MCAKRKCIGQAFVSVYQIHPNAHAHMIVPEQVEIRNIMADVNELVNT